MSLEKKLSLQDLSEKDFSFLAERGYPSFRAGQVFLASRQFRSYAEMNIPSDLKMELSEEFYDRSLTVIKVLTGKDGTEKYLYRLNDGNIVEGVFMPHNYGNTICISTQVGCRMGCAFCASTLNGLVRNLTKGEMLGEVLAVNALKGGSLKKRAITNVVLMGSGEPLDNYENVTEFLRLLSEKNGLNVSLRNVSLSTCGLVEGIRRLADDDLPVTLTVSLHSPYDEKRDLLMPVNRKYPIAEVVKAAKYYFEKTGRRIIFEYTLIKGENSSPADAEKLAAVTRGLNCHVNLIMLNPVKERNLKSVDKDTLKAFTDTLNRLGVSNTLRHSMGNDIEGACGQLRNKYLEEQQKSEDK